MTLEPNQADRKVVVTDTARYKGYRMYQPWRLREIVGDMSTHGLHLLHRKGTNEYLLRTKKGTGHQVETIIIAFAVTDDALVVITQMHEHQNYFKDPDYEQVEIHSFCTESEI
ncbi:hypothetical protein [Halococcus hamelinensis]|nr:hypothetical protein [Halococcus hamelinensis]